MGNRVVSIGSIKKYTNISVDVVYTDVCMDSTPNSNYVAGYDVPLSTIVKTDYYGYLISEDEPDKYVLGLSALPPDGTSKEDAYDKIEIKKKSGFLVDKKNVLYANSVSKYRIDRHVNVKAVQNAIDNIFTWIPGERVLDPEFGNNLRYYLYNGINTYNEEQIVAEIQRCVMKYEPRVRIYKIVNVSTVQDTEENTIRLDVKYTINGIDDQTFNSQYTFNKST